MSNVSDPTTLLSWFLQPVARHQRFVVLIAVLLCATACRSGAAASTPGTAHATTTTTTTTTATTATPTTSSLPPALPASTVPRPTGLIDELIGAPGRRVHIRCVGEGNVTVVLISGFGADASGWAAVESASSAHARVCSSERPGTGTSDPTTSTATFATEAAELHALLSNVGEPGPYVLVGHSFGGAEAVTFASRFRDEVKGLVLVDASPTDWPSVLCAVPQDGTSATAMVLATCGTFTANANSEHLDVAAAFAEVAGIPSLGALPMAVVTATHRELPDGLAATEVTRLNDGWNAGQRAWGALSTASHLVSVEHTGHHIEIDQPDVVIAEITRLLP